MTLLSPIIDQIAHAAMKRCSRLSDGLSRFARPKKFGFDHTPFERVPPLIRNQPRTPKTSAVMPTTAVRMRCSEREEVDVVEDAGVSDDAHQQEDGSTDAQEHRGVLICAEHAYSLSGRPS